MKFTDYFTWTILIALFGAGLVSFVDGQSNAECQRLGDPINDNSDRFISSWKGAVTGIEIVEKKFGDEGKPVETKITLKFGNDGRLSESFLSNARIPAFGKQVYVYDANGRVVKRTTYNPDGTAVLEAVYTYDQTGNLLTKYNRNSKSKVVIGPKQEFKYETDSSYSEFSDGKFVRRIKVARDGHCRIKESTLLKEDGTTENRLTMAYDDQNNLVEQIVFSPSGKEIEKSKYAYEYDERQNWIKKNYFEWRYSDASEKYTLMSEEVRKITYTDLK